MHIKRNDFYLIHFDDSDTGLYFMKHNGDNDTVTHIVKQKVKNK